MGEQSADYDNLLNAARKAVEHGYRVYILPNPNGIRTPVFIFEKRGNYKTYDLKTIMGKSSAGNRLLESIGQSNRVLLNITADYNARPKYIVPISTEYSESDMKNKSHPKVTFKME